MSYLQYSYRFIFSHATLYFLFIPTPIIHTVWIRNIFNLYSKLCLRITPFNELLDMFMFSDLYNFITYFMFSLKITLLKR